MRPLRVLALAGLAVALCAAPAPAKQRHWRMVATASAGYANQVSWSLPCSGTFATRLDLRASFTAADLVYDSRRRSARDALVKTRVTTGRWHAEGSYAPNVIDPVLGYDHVCAPAVAATCDITLRQRSDRSRGSVYVFERRARKLFLRLTGVGIEERHDASQPDFCGGDVVTNSTGGPLLPHVYSEAHNRLLPTPLAKLGGRRAFTVASKLPAPANCTPAYSACAESGGVAFTATFTPR
jgi:hypothetical protein